MYSIKVTTIENNFSAESCNNPKLINWLKKYMDPDAYDNIDQIAILGNEGDIGIISNIVLPFNIDIDKDIIGTIKETCKTIFPADDINHQQLAYDQVERGIGMICKSKRNPANLVADIASMNINQIIYVHLTINLVETSNYFIFKKYSVDININAYKFLIAEE